MAGAVVGLYVPRFSLAPKKRRNWVKLSNGQKDKKLGTEAHQEREQLSEGDGDVVIRRPGNRHLRRETVKKRRSGPARVAGGHGRREQREQR